MVTGRARLIAWHVRKHLESAAFLSLTTERVARYAANYIDASQMQIMVLRTEQESEYNHYIPASIAMLEFFISNLPCIGPKQIYLQEIQLRDECAAAADTLLQGKRDAFAAQSAELFIYARQYIITWYR